MWKIFSKAPKSENTENSNYTLSTPIKHMI